MKGIFLLLGSNLGEKKQHLDDVLLKLNNNGIELIKSSSIYETEAWGKTDQASFYNQVIQINTDLTPEGLLETILKIELQLGRVRTEKWGERLIDIDILYFNDVVIDTANLQIPHKGIPDRRFTLLPLREIAANFIHPVYKKNQKELLKECTDPLSAHKLDI
ncbi:2-amino-4-hydroxy-6-hydroxymethyldihydropteridine diphosphokinase [Marivirga sp. S37H4]|uniref:2-amino-4-hydroxy-6-hydroxymethyldihydropteridine pyrophosphokinase n=1 Tax=Marivirga aurantiaca TaxID=2802615 RepID=A0A934WVL0_9BACT|nr:2-amino-4-hydroxy-6-hydroxymethyldihydropteridine diphosphokinase [Marivirga aurantiaca]MBK6263764.1 2-amino-4-hydroxy-6-hydroxymethyldihydropteridine diphosphokinase [Marivirga aurantiaca]